MSMQSKIVVPPEPLELMGRLEAAGEECWVVGGCVRDSLRGVQPADWDMTTSAAPERMLQIFAGEHLITAGLRHGTVGVVRQGRVYEITTYRVESGMLDHRHPDHLFFTKDVQDDLARRDFTVNAMAYHPQRGLLDCFGGEQDLQKGIIRCVGQPALRFTEDALRILRALRFVAVLGTRYLRVWRSKQYLPHSKRRNSCRISPPSASGASCKSCWKRPLHLRPCRSVQRFGGSFFRNCSGGGRFSSGTCRQMLRYA